MSVNLCPSLVKTEGQNTFVLEIRCSIATVIASLGAVLYSLKKPLVRIKSLLTQLREVVVSISVSTLVDNPFYKYRRS